MMSPKDKAVMLTGKMYNAIYTFWPDPNYHEKAKQAALIAVDYIQDEIDWHEFEYPSKEYDYWVEVRNEIKNL